MYNLDSRCYNCSEVDVAEYARLGQVSGRKRALKGPFPSGGHQQQSYRKMGTWRPEHPCPSLVTHTVLFISHVFLPSYWEEKANAKALSMPCHLLFGSSTKMSGYYLPSSLLTCGSCCFVEMWPFVFLPALCSFPRLHTSPWIAISLICVPRCLVIFSFCFPFLHNGRWQSLG